MTVTTDAVTLQAQNARLRRANHRLGARVRHLQAHIRHEWQPRITSAIRMAAIAFGQPYSMLLRKAQCESHLWPWARNPSGATGLFQFLGSTWRSTPFGAFSIYDVFAQALAAAWMHAHNRGNEWACR